jgi:hypothetical protein
MIQVVHPGSGSRIRILVINTSRIPDTGVNKAPNPGSTVFPRPGPNNKKEKGGKNVCLTFLFSHEFHKIIYYLFLNR